MEIGLLTLGDLLPDPATGVCRNDAQRHRAIVEMCVRAEGLGFDIVHLGEHHGNGYQLSAPPVVLAAIGERTSRLRLSTGVALAPHLDPVRMAEDYATLDCLSGGRTEIVAGRGSFFARTFEYFGQDSGQSRALFDEHVELLVRLLREEEVSHPAGKLRPPLQGFTSRPRPVGQLPVWLGGGASKETPLLAARLGLPLMLPSVFAAPDAFAQFAQVFRDAWQEAGHPGTPLVGACAHCHVAPTSQQARATFEPHYRQYWAWVQELVLAYTPRARPLPFDFDEMLTGPAICGSPAEVIDRIGHWKDVLGLDRLAFMFDLGGIPVPVMDEAMDLFASEVLPEVR